MIVGKQRKRIDRYVTHDTRGGWFPIEADDTDPWIQLNRLTPTCSPGYSGNTYRRSGLVYLWNYMSDKLYFLYWLAKGPGSKQHLYYERIPDNWLRFQN